MEKYIVTKSQNLSGVVEIGGAKNSVLPIMAGCLLTGEKCEIKNVPKLSDVEIMVQLLRDCGAEVNFDNSLSIYCNEVFNQIARDEKARDIRASFLLAGAMLGRFGKAVMPMPGGCSIGLRPVDLHLKGFTSLGAECNIEQGMVNIEAKELKGNDVYLDFPSVGATENIMLAGVLAKGETTISNCAIEPEIVDLAKFLNSIGAKISGAGTDTIVIKGVNELGGCCHRVIPDRIEAGTFMIAVAGAGGNVKIQDVIPEQLRPVISKLKEADVEVKEDENSVTVCSDGFIANTDIKTMPYPGFPTDMQAQFMGLMCGGLGTGIINETVFENRFMQVPEFIKMGADITIEGRCAVVKGVEKMKGAKVRATDLRAGAGLVITGLRAEGVTEITDIHYIDRGYENFDGKLRGIGADIIRINEQAVQ